MKSCEICVDLFIDKKSLSVTLTDDDGMIRPGRGRIIGMKSCEKSFGQSVRSMGWERIFRCARALRDFENFGT